MVVEDAYINYLESRKMMRELALARGFYPVVALDVGAGGGGRQGGGKGSTSTGGSKEKENQKEKGRQAPNPKEAESFLVVEDLCSFDVEEKEMHAVDQVHRRHRHRRRARHLEARLNMGHASSAIACQLPGSRKCQTKWRWSRLRRTTSLPSSTRLTRSTPSTLRLDGRSWTAVLPRLFAEKLSGRRSPTTWSCVDLTNRRSCARTPRTSGSEMESSLDPCSVQPSRCV